MKALIGLLERDENKCAYIVEAESEEDAKGGLRERRVQSRPAAAQDAAAPATRDPRGDARRRGCARADDRAAPAATDWAYISRVSGYHTLYFGRVLAARTRRPLSRRETSSLERASGRIATEIADYEFKRSRMRSTTIDRHVEAFYSKFGLRMREA